MDKKYVITKHRLLLVIAAVGVVLGVSVAAVIASLSSPAEATATGSAAAVSSSPAPAPSSSTSTIDEATDIVTEGPSESSQTFNPGDLDAAEQFIENQTGVQVTLKPIPSKPSSGANPAVTTKPGTSTGTPKPGTSDPTPKICDESNAKVWASCTAGYVAPKIVFAGVKSCTAVDRAAGTWKVTLQLALSGGFHNGVSWSLDDYTSGQKTITIKGITEIPAELPSSFMVTAYAKPMNGMNGSIDIIEGHLSPDLDLRGICN